jgi:TnpA family transposase
VKKLEKLQDFLYFFEFFCFEIKFMKEKNKKQALLAAFDQSETKKAPEACKLAEASLSVYYFHFYKDPNFRRQILEKQAQHTLRSLAAEA